MTERKGENNSEPQVNPGYPLFQIAKALTTAQQHADPATRTRAYQRIAQWTDVFNRIVSGEIKAGSRTPLPEVPAWATLEVITGGFATGKLLADGPLLSHELALLEELQLTPEADSRRSLNRYFLTDAGLARLQAMLHSGCYAVNVPEEGALLVVAWLLDHAHVEAARSLLAELAPWFAELRFYPVPTEHPRRSGTQAHLQTVGQTIESLSRVEPNRQILAQKEAIGVWTTLYDRVIALFLETVEGPVPNLRMGEAGRWERSPSGQFSIEGGWPCQRYPIGWPARAQQLQSEFEQQRSAHLLCQSDRRGRLAELCDYLRRCAVSPQSLTGREVGRIRLMLACHVAKWGMPDSPCHSQLRQRQAMQIRGATFKEVAQVAIARLEAYPADAGLDEVEPVVQPISADEAGRYDIEAGTAVPETLQRKIQRCHREAVDVLVEKGVITSSETLARVLPQITADIQAAGIAEPTLRQLYGSIYQAFRGRRSLLLLNLEKQVQLEELPWITAIDRFRNNLAGRDLAQQILEEVSLLALSAFPHVVIPNKLLQEMRSLAKTAQLDLPLTEEIAADIFMGAFSNKFLQAANQAADLLEGTLYATYYTIDYANIRTLSSPQSPTGRRVWQSDKIPDDQANNLFFKLCELRSGVTYGGFSVAVRGMIIEQQQILTTQNLAVLYQLPAIAEALDNEQLAQACFTWICQRLQIKVETWHATLIQIKNSAYAWRQMLFFLALLPEAAVSRFLFWAEDHLSAQPVAFQHRFHPALLGLILAAHGRSIDDDRTAQRFLGWSAAEHWLTGPPAQSSQEQYP